MAKEKRKRKEREEGRKKEKENYRSCTEMPNGCSNRAGYTMRDLRREISFVGLNSEFKMTIVLTHFLLFFFLTSYHFYHFAFDSSLCTDRLFYFSSNKSQIKA